MGHILAIIVTLSVGVFWATGAAAQPIYFFGDRAQYFREQPAEEWLTQFVAYQLWPEKTIESLLHAVQSGFLTIDYARTGISRQTYTNLRRAKTTKERAARATDAFSLDLNGDGTITFDEARLALTQDALPLAGNRSRDEYITERLARFFPGGPNQVLQIADLYREADQTASEESQIEKLRLELGLRSFPEWLLVAPGAIPPTLDPNGDGILTLDEFLGLLRPRFEAIDENGDGIISASEAIKYLRATKLDRMVGSIETNAPMQAAASERERCKPPLPRSGRLLLVSALPGAIATATALSRLSFDDRHSHAEVTVLRIDAGSEPLHLVLHSQKRRIWLFTGATERVATVVTNDGVVGIPPEMVHFSEQRRCVPFFVLPRHPSLIGNRDFNYEDGVQVFSARETATKAYGRKPDHLLNLWSASTYHIPSGTPAPTASIPGAGPPRPGNAALEEGPYRVVEIDPSQVVAPAPLARYETLPGYAGLAQLLDAGSISALNAEGTEYRINQRIRFLPRVRGNIKFVLTRGVAEPDESFDCIIDEVTGKAIPNSFFGDCRVSVRSRLRP